MFEHLPRFRQDRWSLVQDFINHWYQPLNNHDGYTDDELVLAEALLGFRLPTALREWYALSGKRGDIWQTQDVFYAPQDLLVNQDLLLFYRENQGCFTWSIPMDAIAMEDPPVVCDWEGTIDQVSSTISEYVIQQLLYVTKFNFCSSFSATCCDRVLKIIQTRYTRCDLPEWFVFDAAICFFEAPDIVIELWCHDQGREFWVTTPNQKSQKAVEQFFNDLGVVFE